jgi:hypothetical protein
MNIPNEIWITMGYVAGGIVIALCACLFGPLVGRYVIGFIADAFGIGR